MNYNLKKKGISIGVAFLLCAQIGVSEGHASSDLPLLSQVTSIKTLKNNSNLKSNTLLPVSSVKIRKFPKLAEFTQKQISMLSQQDIVLNFKGTECRFTFKKGCIVFKSNSTQFKMGAIIKTYQSTLSSETFEETSFHECGWCGFVGDILAIVVFVATAPASAPSALLLVTYSVGSGLILYHA